MVDSVIRHSRDHAPYPASRIFNVTFSAWGQMNMAVEDGLPSGFSAIDSDVESCDSGVLALNKRFRLAD